MKVSDLISANEILLGIKNQEESCMVMPDGHVETFKLLEINAGDPVESAIVKVSETIGECKEWELPFMQMVEARSGQDFEFTRVWK